MICEKLISIIIPVYNAENYLEKCLDSITHQTYSNLEIILINDASTDKSYDICNKYARRDKRIVLVDKKKNTGAADTRNRALEIAKGDCIGFLDCDDYVEFNMYEKLTNAMHEYNAEISMCDTCIIGDEARRKIRLNDNALHGKMDTKTALKELMLDRNVASYLWVKLFDKKLFDGIRFPRVEPFEDVATVYKLFERAAYVIYIKECLHYRIMRAGSSSSSRPIVGYLDVIFNRYYDMKRNYPDLQPYNVYTLVDALIRMFRLAVSDEFHTDKFCDLYNDKLTYYYNILRNELDCVDEGELVKIISTFEKMSLYMLAIDKDVYINVLKELIVKYPKYTTWFG